MINNKNRFYRNKIRLQALLKEYGKYSKVAKICGVQEQTIIRYAKQFGIYKPKPKKPRAKKKRKKTAEYYKTRIKDKVIYAYIPKLEFTYQSKSENVVYIHEIFEIESKRDIQFNFKSEKFDKLIKLKEAIGYELELEIGQNREKWNARDYYYEYGFEKKLGKLNTLEFKEKNPKYENLKTNNSKDSETENMLKIDGIERLRINIKRCFNKHQTALWLTEINEKLSKFEYHYFHGNEKERQKAHAKLEQEYMEKLGFETDFKNNEKDLQEHKRFNDMVNSITFGVFPEMDEFKKKREQIDGISGFTLHTENFGISCPFYIQGWLWKDTGYYDFDEMENRTCIDCGKEFQGFDWQSRCLECYRKYSSLN